LVAILLEQPQQDIDAPAAYVARPGLGLDANAIERPEPLPYRQLPELYSALEAERRPGGTGKRARSPQTARVNARKKPTHRGRGRAASASMAKRKEKANQRQRPGSGGRQPRQAKGTSTTATAQLQAALGEPTKVRTGQRGARSEIWERPDLSALISLVQDRQGALGSASLRQEEAPSRKQRVVLVNRLSSQEIQGGETIAGQIFDGLRTAMANTLEIVAVISSTNYWSELTFEERDDFNWIFEQVELGQLDGVVFREPDRVARKQAIVHPFYDKCRRLGIDVYLASRGRKVDWESSGDVMHISLENALAEVEAKKIAKRMQEAKRRRWVEEGRGWPGCKRFGFRRNQETKYLEVDPEQWPAIEFIHNNYGRLSKGRKNGCKAIAEELAEMGFDLSAEKVRKILQDPIYVDGTYTVTVDGAVAACEPIPLERPIPREVFQRNQEMLAAQKGTYSKVPLGTNAFNGIVVEHAACNHWTDPKTGHPPRLRINNSRAGEPSYWHRGKHPKGCHGYRVPQKEFEAAVVHRLLELAEDEDVQEAWATAVLVTDSPGGGSGGGAGPGGEEDLETSLEVQRLQLTEQVANLEAEHERQVRQLVDLAGAGQEITATHRAVAEQIEDQLKARRKRLSVLKANAERRHEEKARAAGQEELLDALRAVLTVEIPDEEDRRIRRQALLECCLSKVVVRDVEVEDESERSFEIKLLGPLVPKAATENLGQTLPVSPLDAAAHVLEAEIRERESDGGGGEDPGNSSTQVLTYVELFRLREWRSSPEGRRAERDRRLLENPWPERFRGIRGPLVPAWSSPYLRVGPVPPRNRRPGEAQCRQALRDAAASLPPHQRLTWNAYKAWFRADPAHRPPPWAIRRVATTLGMNFSELRNQVLPPERGHKKRRPDGYWTLERCQEALAQAVAEHAAVHDSPLTERGYRKLCSWREDLPSVKRLSKVAREHGTSIGEMLRLDATGP
jgi:DNA invertase Pin-like site-specific DNA recombinase